MTQYFRTGLLFLLVFCASTGIWAQNYSGQPVNHNSQAVKNRLTAWQVYHLDSKAIYDYAKQQHSNFDLNLELGARNWNLHLNYNYNLMKDYRLVVHSETGETVSHTTTVLPFQGYEKNTSGAISLTLNENFVYGYFREENEHWFIEPLQLYDPNADPDDFIVYKRSDVIYDTEATCATVEVDKLTEEYLNDTEKINETESSACVVLEIAVAADKSMFNKYGSVAAVENHNVGVLNDVQGNYTGWFNYDLEFNIVTQFVVTGTDPWTNSTNAGTLLGDFRDWGESGNFGVSYDVAELWTNRDFAGSTIGIAYVGGICNTIKYHCLQDFDTNAELLRCMTAHEMGHNFNAQHDVTGCPPNYIMCPFVSTSNTWSTTSINTINSYMQPRVNNGCLGPCGPPPVPLVADFDFQNPACVGQPVSFQALSSGVISTYSWVFTGGTPGTSSLPNPTSTWNTSGTYNVKLTISGSAGSSTITKQITINPLPVANFTSMVDGLSVQFTSTSSNASSYTWDFGDGVGYSYDPNPYYTYSDAGTYVVTLVVENDCGSATRTAVVNTAPSAQFSASLQEGCAPLVVTFINESSSNALSYVWSFPGGAPSNSSALNPVVVYNTPGVYSVTLTAFNGSGSTTYTQNNYITVLGNPTSNFSSTHNGLTVSFTNLSTSGTTYLWNFGDGNTSTAANPTHTYAVGGTYTVTLTTTNGCGSVTSTNVVQLTPPPSAAFTFGPANGCGPLTVTFTNNSTGATSYAWSFPGGTPSSSTAVNPTVNYTTPGSFNVVLIAGNAGGNDTLITNNAVTVNPAPSAGFTNTINGNTVNFTNTSNNGVSYSWNFGDGNVSMAASPNHTYVGEGVYTVVLTATNPCGTSTFTQVVTIVEAPLAAFSASQQVGCAPFVVQFTNQSSSNAVSFEWQFPGGIPSSSTETNPQVQYLSPGSYSVTLIATNSVGSGTVTEVNYIVVSTVPNAGFTSNVNGANVDFNNGSTGASTYSWNFGDNQSSTAANPSHTYTADGVYTVVLTATNACGASTSTSTVTIVTPPTAAFSVGSQVGCAPYTVQFNNNSSSNATNFEWQFPGGTPSSSTESSPTVVYSTPGVYSVSLLASNAAGSATLTESNFITVGTIPAVGFTSSNNGASVSFSNSSSGANTYSWDFGDNESSNAANPTHNYTADGVYTVVLTATNDCGSSTSTATVTIVTPPTAAFNVSSNIGCAPFTVQFNSTSSTNTSSIAWTFENGNPSTSTDPNPSVSWNQAGSYTVVLVASNSAGSSSSTAVINVGTTPTPGFNTSVNGATTDFENTSTGANTYSWDFGDAGTSTLENPSHTYAMDGVYTVVLTASNDCGSSTTTTTLTIVTPPTAAFTADAISGCAPLTVNFTNNSSDNATTFKWSFEGGDPSASNDPNPSVTWTEAGTYTVVLIAENSAGSSTSTVVITVNTVPSAAYDVQLAGLSALFTNLSVNANTYHWDFGDGNSSAETNPEHAYTEPGAYNVILAATNECGTTEFTSSVEIVGSAPIAAFEAESNAGCAPFSIQFTDLSEGDPSAWLWNFPGGFPAQSTVQNPVVVYNTPGLYSVTLEVTNAYGASQTGVQSYIMVETVPSVGFTYNTALGTVNFSNSSLNADNYLWNFGDGNSSNEANPSHTYASSGTYTVELTAFNNCGASTLQQVVMVIVSGVYDQEWVENFQLYPNPNNGTFMLDLKAKPSRELEFQLYNSIGQLIQHESAEFSLGSIHHTFQYGNLAAGVYTLSIQSGGNRMFVKVIVQ